ncbi:hypothetical protein [Sphingomonas sp. PAMC 26621]|uniref:hypothetical protein n=1 Tax=Sphingomonas sp. PAMC 26621 TaxID=1112213 RepID=UPI000287D27A|nr:hypothetical protein [Sphingomonas sp. PAMC 26621]
MNIVVIFWLQLVASLFVAGVVAFWYVAPRLMKMPMGSALTLLLFVHVPRYVGMTLLVPTMVDPKVPAQFLFNAAYGDLVEAVLAFACIMVLRVNGQFAIPLVWIANIWGFLDLLNGVRGVVVLDIPRFDIARSGTSTPFTPRSSAFHMS